MLGEDCRKARVTACSGVLQRRQKVVTPVGVRCDSYSADPLFNIKELKAARVDRPAARRAAGRGIDPAYALGEAAAPDRRDPPWSARCVGERGLLTDRMRVQRGVAGGAVHGGDDRFEPQRIAISRRSSALQDRRGSAVRWSRSRSGRRPRRRAHAAASRSPAVAHEVAAHLQHRQPPSRRQPPRRSLPPVGGRDHFAELVDDHRRCARARVAQQAKAGWSPAAGSCDHADRQRIHKKDCEPMISRPAAASGASSWRSERNSPAGACVASGGLARDQPSTRAAGTIAVSRRCVRSTSPSASGRDRRWRRPPTRSAPESTRATGLLYGLHLL